MQNYTGIHSITEPDFALEHEFKLEYILKLNRILKVITGLQNQSRRSEFEAVAL